MRTEQLAPDLLGKLKKRLIVVHDASVQPSHAGVPNPLRRRRAQVPAAHSAAISARVPLPRPAADCQRLQPAGALL
jgi:hypothetical protein